MRHTQRRGQKMRAPHAVAKVKLRRTRYRLSRDFQPVDTPCTSVVWSSQDDQISASKSAKLEAAQREAGGGGCGEIIVPSNCPPLFAAHCGAQGPGTTGAAPSQRRT